MRDVLPQTSPLRDLAFGGLAAADGSDPAHTKVVAVVAAHGPAHLVADTLDSLTAQTRPPDATIVVNDGCHTGASLAGFGPHVPMVDAVGNTGCRPGALNLVLDEVTSMLTDDDVVIITDETVLVDRAFVATAVRQLHGPPPPLPRLRWPRRHRCQRVGAVVTGGRFAEQPCGLVSGVRHHLGDPGVGAWVCGAVGVAALRRVRQARTNGQLPDRCGHGGIFDTRAANANLELVAALHSQGFGTLTAATGLVDVQPPPDNAPRVSRAWSGGWRYAAGVADTALWHLRARVHRSRRSDPATTPPPPTAVLPSNLVTPVAFPLLVAVAATVLSTAALVAGVEPVAGALAAVTVVGLVMHHCWSIRTQPRAARVACLLVVPWMAGVLTRWLGAVGAFLAATYRAPAVVGRRRQAARDGNRATSPLAVPRGDHGAETAIPGHDVPLHPIPGSRHRQAPPLTPLAPAPTAATRVAGVVAVVAVVALVTVLTVGVTVAAPVGTQMALVTLGVGWATMAATRRLRHR